MNISELSIRRPVMATVVTLVIILFGMIGYTYLGCTRVSQCRQSDYLRVVFLSRCQCRCDREPDYGASRTEYQRIPGIRSLTSVSQQGSSRITVEFELSVDLETAANDVRDKVSGLNVIYPETATLRPYRKLMPDAQPILMVALQSDKRPLLELSEIADLTVKEQLQTISDVSSVSIWGEKRYSMRLWLDPIKMAGYGVTPVDIKNAVDNENVELPSGSIEGIRPS